MRKARAEAGFTLTEMMMTVAVLGILFAAAPVLMIQFQRFMLLTQSKQAIQRDSRSALDTINRFIRQGKASTFIVDQVSGQPPYSRVSFTTDDGRSVSIYQRGQYLYAEIAGTKSTLSENLRFISFTYPRTDDNEILSVAITTEKATYEGAAKALTLSIEKVRIMN